MSLEPDVVIEVFGEGKTDLGSGDATSRPTAGVVPILLHRLCGRPDRMLVKRKATQFLQGKGLAQKVHFAKRQAVYNRSHAVVFVMDSEGGNQELKKRKAQLEEGRDRGFPEFAMAVGVAQPCIESWLLADAAAIRRGLDLPATPPVPDRPEDLPAPCQDAIRNPKAVLGSLGGGGRPLSAAQKDGIARAMNDLDLVRARCPLGFGPFANEVDEHIRPLFSA